MTSADGALGDQPFAIVERDGVRFTLLGTAHVSQASIDAVENCIASGNYDTIAVELDSNRLRALTEPDQLYKLDLFQILREKKTGLVAANLALAAYQRRLAEQLGVEPGAELKAAAVGAKQRGLTLATIDRDVGVTFKRAWHKLGFWGRSKLLTGLAASLLVDEKVEEDEIEKLKQGDMLESSFGEFARQTPELYEAVIDERDRYMAARLRQVGNTGNPREVLAVVGAGHLKGLAEHLRSENDAPEIILGELDGQPKQSRIPWVTLAIAVLVLGSFAWGYWHGGAHLGTTLVITWFVSTAIGAALGCLAAGGHPLSVLGGALWAPFKPFHPGIASGTVSAFIETSLRRPTYQDFMSLRDDVTTLRGWYRNRVARTFLNFFFTCMGTIAGEVVAISYIAGKLG
jgi:pheromone shutdown-related protein TraB